MTLRIEQGKGAKDRYAMLSPVLLEAVCRAAALAARPLGRYASRAWAV